MESNAIEILKYVFPLNNSVSGIGNCSKMIAFETLLK
jgi:hypothetical protein